MTSKDLKEEIRETKIMKHLEEEIMVKVIITKEFIMNLLKIHQKGLERKEVLKGMEKKERDSLKTKRIGMNLIEI